MRFRGIGVIVAHLVVQRLFAYVKNPLGMGVLTDGIGCG